MNRRISASGLVLVLLLAGIMIVPLLRAGRVPIMGSTFRSSLLPTPGPTSVTPGPSGTPPLPPTVPPPTVVFPTPDTPVPNAPIIAEDQAIAIALSQNPYFVERRQRGELTVTSKLTIHGDRQAGTTGDLAVHPQLRVWLVYLHVAPWTQLAGPVGRRIEVQYNVIWYEIDATSGKLVGGGRSFIPEVATPSVTPEVAP